LRAGAPLPRCARATGPWRIWQEFPVTAAGAAAALRREAQRDLAGVWLRVDSGEVTASQLGALLAAAPGAELAGEAAHEPGALAALLVAASGERGGGPPAGCLGGDPLGALARRGSISGNAREQLVASARWTAAEAPALRAALVSTAPYAGAGADA